MSETQINFTQKVIPSKSQPGKHTFICPNCGNDHGSTIDHLNPGESGCGWTCGHCRRGISVFQDNSLNDTIVCTLTNKYYFKTLVLLRLNVATPKPIHIVVDGGRQIEIEDSDHRPREEILAEYLTKNPKADEYYYNEHTCPWNYLRLPIAEGDDSDPHGLFVHQETIPMPKGYKNSLTQLQEVKDLDLQGYAVWLHYFPSLRK